MEEVGSLQDRLPRMSMARLSLLGVGSRLESLRSESRKMSSTRPHEHLRSAGGCADVGAGAGAGSSAASPVSRVMDLRRSGEPMLDWQLSAREARRLPHDLGARRQHLLQQSASRSRPLAAAAATGGRGPAGWPAGRDSLERLGQCCSLGASLVASEGPCSSGR